MKIFSKKHRKKVNDQNRRIVEKSINKYQSKLSENLTDFDSKLSNKNKWLLYSTVFIVMLLVLSYSLISSFNYKPKESIDITKSKAFIYYPNMGFERERPVYVDMKSEAKMLEKFLDSLKNNPETYDVYRDLISNRPGLLDSISYYKNN